MSGFWTRFGEHLGLGDIEHLARKKQIPIHHDSFWYYLGGMTLFLFISQAVTGILLVLYYRPSPNNAYESVQFLMTNVSFGWLVRSFHAWGANLMILTAFIHFFSTMLLKAYRPPREGTWLTGAFLLALVLTFGFTGYLLPWNMLSYFATRVGTNIPGTLPLIGDLVRRVMRAGEDVSGATLTRFYGVHVAVLPAFTTVFLTFHLFLVQKHGMSVPIGVQQRGGPSRTVSFFPNYVLRDGIGWLSAIGLMAALSALVPASLGKKADPFASAPAGIKPEWYFLAFFQTLKMIPSRVLGIAGDTAGVVVMLIVALIIAAIPFLDRRSARERPSPIFTAIALALILYLVVFTLLSMAGGPRSA
jgi:cytochrome b6